MELLNCLLGVSRFIGMQLQGQLLIGPVDILQWGVLLDAQQNIIVHSGGSRHTDCSVYVAVNLKRREEEWRGR